MAGSDATSETSQGGTRAADYGVTAHPNRAALVLSPFEKLRRAAGLTLLDIQAATQPHLDAAPLRKLSRNGESVMRIPLATLYRVSTALGCAPSDLIPSLAQRPRRGLLWDRGVFREEPKRKSRAKPSEEE